MKNQQIKLLENLVKIPGPSGFEEKIAEFIKKELLDYLPPSCVKIDFQKNVVGIIKGTSDKVIMVDAHTDQIGFIVTNVSRDGYREGLISVQYIGGGDTSILSARDLVILSSKGKNVNAVVNRKHSHLVEDEDEIQITKIRDAIIDIGVRKRSKVLSIVAVGDPLVYKPSFNHLTEGYFSGYGFDDRSGCYILLETIREIIKSKRKPIPTLIFAFSGQEETGGGKCKPLIRKYRPDLFIELDVTFATDCGTDEEMETEVGCCELNKGLVLYKGVDIDKNYVELMDLVARSNKIRIQYQAATGQVGYTPTSLSSEGNGIRNLIMGIPLRNTHSPTEIINLNDLNSGTQLLVKFLQHRNIIVPLVD